jgi:hypothetical protein
MPGRGAAGTEGADLAWRNRSKISGRGGTTGRATGWPAKGGLEAGRACPGNPPAGPAACGRKGLAGDGLCANGGRVGWIGCCCGRGVPGNPPGRGAPASTRFTTGWPGPAAVAAHGCAGGSGCRGPERICPGRGVGIGFAGSVTIGLGAAGAGAIASRIRGCAGAAGCCTCG